MTRKECLDAAAGCVLKDRNASYGGPEDNFGRIARLWTAYTGTVLDGIDVAMMMALLKVARIRNNKSYEDGYIDLAGYAACGAELAGAEKAREDATRRWGEEYKKLREQAEGGCCQNGNDHANPLSFKEQAKAFARENPPEEPRFEHGDKVQCRVTLPSVSDRLWVDGEYVRYEKGRSRPHVVFTRAALELVSDEDIRPAPKAEGCEEQVQKDAPQTKEELMQRIVDCNPATFHAPSYAEEQLEHHSRLQAHKPTGEELAEMAEEKGR